MKGTRHQEGYLYRKGSLWLLRYYDSEFVADGSVRRVQKTKKLAAAGLRCPNKTAARDLAREFLESINLARNTPESAMTLIRFTEDRYLPFVEEAEADQHLPWLSEHVEALPEAALRHHAARIQDG